MDFVSFLNDLHENITFTVQAEQNGQLPFWVILIKIHQDGTLGHVVYQKVTHTNLYLNNWSHYHPAQKSSMILTLLDRAHHVPDMDHLKDKLESGVLPEWLCSSRYKACVYEL